MQDGILHMHSGLRWVVLILIILAIFKAMTGKNTDYTAGEKKLALFTLISFHIQVLLGFYLYFTSVKVSFEEGFMGSTLLRFFAVEHIFGMVIAAVLVTMGYSKSKKAIEAVDKRKKIKVFYTIALIIVLATIPWPFREVLLSGWF